MKIVVTGLRGIPDVVGGIESHCRQVYPRIVARRAGFEAVVHGRTPYIGRKAYTYAGVRVQPVWTVRAKLLETILHTFLSILRARFVDRPDLLHIHAIGPALLAPLARALGMRMVSTHHGEDYRRTKWGPVARLALRAGEYLAVRFAEQTICVAPSVARRLKARFPRHAERIHFVPNGAAIATPAPNDDEVLSELGVSPYGYVLAVGRFVPEKGFQDLIAAHGVAPSAPPLVIVGGADHEDAFSAALRAHGSPRVIFAGVRRGGALAVLYRAAGLFVLPSHHEGHPIVALEALRSGAPILLSDIPANRDLGLETDNYFPVGDTAALGKRLESGEYQKLRAGDAFSLDAYDWDRIADTTAEVLRRAVA